MRLILIYAAGGAVLLGVSWRAFSRFRVRLRQNGALHSPHETVRRAAVRECVAIGAGETARLLVRVIRTETSRAVLDDLVIALAERQWEPVSRPAMIELRIWARTYALDHPEVLVVASHAPGEPDTAAQAAAAATPEKPAEVVEVIAQGGGPAAQAADPPGLSGRMRSAIAEVASATVIVTGTSGPAATATIRELKRLGHRVIGVDRDPLSAGLRLADVSEVMPPPDEPAFAVCLIQAARRHGAAALICTAADEHDALDTAAEELTAAGVRRALPRLDAVQTCADKSRLHVTLLENGLPAPIARPGHAADAGEPGPVRPYRRAGWTGAASADAAEIMARLARRDGLMTSSTMGGREFTADVLVSEDNQLAGIVTHWRLETIAGVSARAETFSDHRVSDTCIRALKAVQLTGPASVLGLVTADREVMLLDVNPYFSAELPLSLHAGGDLVGQHLRQIFGLPLLTERLTPRPAVIMTRDFHETFEE